jgi:hypothetical protein
MVGATAIGFSFGGSVNAGRSSQAARCSTIFLGGNMHVFGRKSWDERGELEDPSMVLGAAVPPGWPPRQQILARQLIR